MYLWHERTKPASLREVKLSKDKKTGEKTVTVKFRVELDADDMALLNIDPEGFAALIEKGQARNSVGLYNLHISGRTWELLGKEVSLDKPILECTELRLPEPRPQLAFHWADEEPPERANPRDVSVWLTVSGTLTPLDLKPDVYVGLHNDLSGSVDIEFESVEYIKRVMREVSKLHNLLDLLVCEKHQTPAEAERRLLSSALSRREFGGSICAAFYETIGVYRRLGNCRADGLLDLTVEAFKRSLADGLDMIESHFGVRLEHAPTSADAPEKATEQTKRRKTRTTNGAASATAH